MHAISTMTAPVALIDRLSRLERGVYAVEKLACITALAVMLFAIASSVLVRYLNLPLPNLSEVGVVMMAPLTFIGMAMCTYTGTHIAVDIVNTLRSSLLRRAGRFFTAVASIVFATVYLKTSWVFFHDALESGEKMMDLGTPLALPLFFLPLGVALVLFHSALEVWRTIADIAPVGHEESAS
jgi:TRAP-type C4-dicarboxylate transport system permease small subunit